MGDLVERSRKLVEYLEDVPDCDRPVQMSEYDARQCGGCTPCLLEQAQDLMRSLADEVERLGQRTSMADMVKAFHIAHQIPIAPLPTMLTPDRRMLRLRLMLSELAEYGDATTLVDEADALVDLAYVVFGTVLEHGLNDVFIDLFTEVHRANMAKLGGPVDSHGKVGKPEGWEPPDLKKILMGFQLSRRIYEALADEADGGG